MKGELRLTTGNLVHSFLMPDFKTLPDVATWGSRVFILKEGSRALNSAVYFEATAWSVDASDTLAKKRS
jgi:hypothetical protein